MAEIIDFSLCRIQPLKKKENFITCQGREITELMSLLAWVVDCIQATNGERRS